MAKSSKHILDYVLSENVIQFGGGSEIWRWSVKKKKVGWENPDSNSEGETSTEHTSVVALPHDPKLRATHMTRIMKQYHEKLMQDNPQASHRSHIHPDKPFGRNHGTHWVDDAEGMNSYSHHFEKVN